MSKLDINKELLKNINNDPLARKKLIELNMQLVYDIVHKRYSSKVSEYELDDLFQVGAIGLINAVDKFDLNYSNAFSTFAYRCIDNEIKMYLRIKNKNQLPVSLDVNIYDDVELIDTLVDDINIENTVIINDEYEFLIFAIKTLTDYEQEMIKLYYFDDLDMKTIAEIFNLKPCTISKRLTTIRKKLENTIKHRKVFKILKKDIN